jgi:hypothetical protein
MAQMIYSGAWGKLIHEKNQKSKISWHCPFNGVLWIGIALKPIRIRLSILMPIRILHQVVTCWVIGTFFCCFYSHQCQSTLIFLSSQRHSSSELREVSRISYSEQFLQIFLFETFAGFSRNYIAYSAIFPLFSMVCKTGSLSTAPGTEIHS